MEAVYLAVTVRLPWWRYGGRLTFWSRVLGEKWPTFFLCLGGVGLLVAAYLVGWRLVRRGLASRRVVWGGAIVFALTLFWLLPITSDLFNYLVQAHQFTDLGRNPLLEAPRAVGEDAFWTNYPTAYMAQPSAYGPAWVLLSAPAAPGGSNVAGGLAYLKGLAAIGYLGSAWLLERLLRETRPALALEGLYLFAWNPLVVAMAVGDGHNDVVMMALVLLSLWLVGRRRWTLAGGVLALSAWIKYVSLLFVPLILLYAWQQRAQREGEGLWPVVARGGTGLVVVSALVWLPFGSPAWAAGAAERLLEPTSPVAATTALTFWGLRIGLLAFAACYTLWLLRSVRRGLGFEGLLEWTFLISLAAFLLGAVRSQPWHLLWPATLAGLSTRRWAWPVVVALSALMLAAQIWVEWGAPGLGAGI